MNLEIFNYENSNVRAFEQDGQVWFVAKDVCDVLDLTNPSVALDRLEPDERAKFNLGRQGLTNMVNEYGLYNLILGSRKPEARKFKRWVTHEVLPSIRKRGSYVAAKDMSVAQMLNQQVAIVINEVDNLNGRVEYLEDNMTVDFGQQNRLQAKAKETAIKSLGGMDSPAYADKSLTRRVFSTLWRDYKDYFAVASYRDTSRVDFDKALSYLANWRPQGALLREIEFANEGAEMCVG